MKTLLLLAALAATTPSGPPPGMTVAMMVKGLPKDGTRAERPEQVTVVLTTKDGRQWKARWEEYKP